MSIKFHILYKDDIYHDRDLELDPTRVILTVLHL